MNTTREVVAPAMRAAAEDMCGGDAERLYTSDTRDLMGFFVILRKLLREVGAVCKCSGVLLLIIAVWNS
jgi:kinetochore protein Nuf2